MTTVEVRGAGFSNKGAELMLRTTVERLRRRDPAPRVVMEPRPSTCYEDQARLLIGSIFPCFTLFRGRTRSLLLRSRPALSLALAWQRMVVPRRAYGPLGLTDRRDCDALIDIAGYSYGDKFSWTRSRAAAEAAQEYGRSGKPVVFLPQMFGPFKKRKIAEEFKRACEHATLIYAREQRSYEMLAGLIGEDPRLRVSPDITIAAQVAESSTGALAAAETAPGDGQGGASPAEPYACLVTNERMLDQGRSEWGDSYKDRLLAVINQLQSVGLRIYMVIHSTDAGDRKIAEELKDACSKPEEVRFYDNPDPYALKGFISKSEFLVASRFHSVVAALSTGVPAILLGWAHKYEMLAADFGVPDFMHRGSDAAGSLTALVDRLLDPAENQQVRATLRERGAVLRSKVEAMWDEVGTAIGWS